MYWYPLVKIVHFLGLVALFGFFVIQTRAGGRLRTSATRDDARTWLGLLDEARPMVSGGFSMMLLSGLIMMAMRWRGPYPFTTVGLATLLVLWIVWAIYGWRHLRAVRAAVGDSDGPLPDEIRRLILDPAAWALAGVINGATLGVLAVMTLKPGWLFAATIVVGLSALVSFALSATARRQRDASG